MIDLVVNKSSAFIPKTVTRDQSKDTGMAMVLICLLFGLLGQKHFFLKAAVVLLLLDMIWPAAYGPAAKLWLGLSHLLGTVMSKVLLTVLFFLIVTPVGIARRMAGKDSLQIKGWKTGKISVFRIRDHIFTSEDIHHPY